MPFIQIILALIGALPSIIELIRSITRDVEKLPKAERAQARAKLKKIALNHLVCNDEESCKAELMKFHEELKKPAV